MTMTYDKTSLHALRHNETADCTVRALSIAADISYDEAHQICEDLGRPHRRGFRMPVEQCFKLAGCVATKVDHTYRSSYGTHQMTVATVAKRFPRGSYIARIRGHVLAIVDGQVQDWSVGRRFKLNGLWRVTKQRQMPEPQPVVKPSNLGVCPAPQHKERSGQYIQRMLLAQCYTDNQIAIYAKMYFAVKSGVKGVAWYRSKLRSQGHNIRKIK